MVQEFQKYIPYQKKVIRAHFLRNIGMLFLPSFLMCLILLSSVFTYGVSILLTYFVLPMFYAADCRLRHAITGIGKEKFSYIDGYKAFFQSNKGGIFGVFLTVAAAIGILLVMLFALGTAIPGIVSCFPESQDAFKEMLGLISDFSLMRKDMTRFLIERGYEMVRPFTIYIGLSMFLPMVFIIFFGVNENLSYHYISTVVFPDLDLNIPSSQSRSVARVFSRGFNAYRLKRSFFMNLPFYLVFAILYGFSLWGVSYIRVGNSRDAIFTSLIVPAFAIISGAILNYCCMMNNYCMIEADQAELRESMPVAMRTSVYQTYSSKEYIHGEESKKRGCFVDVSSYFGNDAKNNPPSIAVVDFSKDADDEKEKK